MTVRQRIIFLIALTFAALGGVGGVALYQSHQGAREVKAVTEGVVPSTIQSVELMGQLKDIQIATLAMVAAPDKEAALGLHGELSARRTGLQQALDAQQQQADSPAQRGLIEEARHSLDNYFAAIDDTVRLKLAGQQEAAEATMAATVDQYLREQGQMIDAVQVEKRRSKDQAIEALNQNLRNTSATLAAVTVVSVLGLALIGYLLYRQIIQPLGDMEHKMTAIAASQDFTHRVPVKRQDEIGRSIVAFNTMIEKIEHSSALVRQKSADIQALLHAIPQGILTLQAGGRIHPEFSEHLATLLGTRDIAGRPVAQVIFAHTDLGADATAQALAAIDACIGEEAMNFDFNAHLLPREIGRPQPDGTLCLWELGWSPIVSEDGTIERLMLCIRDVTELRQLARAAQAQQQELAIIGEILALERSKFHAFAAGAGAFIQASQQLVRTADQAPEERPAAMAALFRHMHTIKGNARTYGLLQLADAAHAAEQRYESLRQDVSAWDTGALLADLSAVQAMLDVYQSVEAVKLRDRSAPADKTGASGRALPHPQVQDLAQQLHDAAGSTDLQALQAITAHAARTLQQWSSLRLAQALGGTIASLPALATELAKEPPVVQVNDGNIAVPSAIADMLRDVFTHLLRNAMDHGIEPAAERVRAGKPAAGRIEIAATLQGQTLQLRMADDGRGLDLGRIHARAIEAGLLAAHEQPSEEALAQCIFAPGFSTASAVTAVSGRGVGMDAVKAFVTAHGGDVALRLRTATASAAHRAFDILIHLPARFALQARG